MPDFYVIEVALKDVIPRIWRRFMITTEALFVDLHEAIQDACGWQNCHLFQFQDEEGRILAELPGDEDDETGPDAMTLPIKGALGRRKGKELLYLYDFGDGWEHEVTVIDIEKDWPEEFGRRLLGGESAFPTEDFGRTDEYEECTIDVVLGRKKDLERYACWAADISRNSTSRRPIGSCTTTSAIERDHPSAKDRCFT